MFFFPNMPSGLTACRLFAQEDDFKSFSPLTILQVGSYGGKLKYTISFVAGQRGTVLDDGDVQIIVSTAAALFAVTAVDLVTERVVSSCLQGNDITLVARLPWQRRQQGSRETKQFEVVFKEVSGRTDGRMDGGMNG